MTEEPTTRKQTSLHDFATIFSHLWYRDFPLQRSLRDRAQPADWTTHIGIVVRSTADLMGLFTHFESGQRTDAVLRDTNGPVALLEWEWKSLHRGDAIVTEFEKLKRLCTDGEFQAVHFAGLIGYARENSARARADRADYGRLSAKILEGYTERWPLQCPPLLLALIHFENAGKVKDHQKRRFIKLTTHRIAEGRNKLLRDQPAYPWDVTGSRWAHETKSCE
jgi:hypothetical protein